MKRLIAIIIVSFLALTGCQQFSQSAGSNQHGYQNSTSGCRVSANQVLACLASTKQLSQKENLSEFNTLFKSWKTKPDRTNPNRLLCLSLLPHSSQKQLQQAESILEETLRKYQYNKQDLTGLLHLIQGNILLHKQYLDTNWKLYLEKKRLYEQNNMEVTTYQRRIQDLEKQVQKLIEIESMLDQKVQP
ncbi:MAG TPA: hypothetical protein EYP35_02860 [Desulfobacterales bacterium]|nr:hypothetical protein [Desulfobacterales bacterium]HIP39355.1 hypothetical protein [Desulfocapsa sulfexigens]